MKALLFTGNGNMELVEREMPKAKGNVVVVKMLLSGICGTDIELLLPNASDIVPGHEGVGVVYETDGAKRFKVGDRVIINCHVTCRHCGHCAAGDEIFCPELKAIGFELPGTNEQFLVIPEESLRPLPDDISEEVGVLIGDALGTPYHAVKMANIAPGDFVGVWGAGPLGMMAMFVASKFGARVVAVDVNNIRLDQAKQYGATYTLNPADGDVNARIRELTGGAGLKSAIQCTPSGKAVVAALQCLGLRGILVQVGVCTHVEFDLYGLLNERELSIRASRNFNANELEELIELARANPDIQKLVTHSFPLDQAQEAFQCAKEGRGLKVVLRPND